MRATVVVSEIGISSTFPGKGSSCLISPSVAEVAWDLSSCEYNGSGVGQPAGYSNSQSSFSWLVCVVKEGVFSGGYEFCKGSLMAGISEGTPD